MSANYRKGHQSRVLKDQHEFHRWHEHQGQRYIRGKSRDMGNGQLLTVLPNQPQRHPAGRT